MKKIIIHTIPVLISLIWVIIFHHTCNPVSLKGSDFLKFYLILLIGFYGSVLLLKQLNESISKATFYFMISIFLLGAVKLIRGIYLEKSIGFLAVILFSQVVTTIVFMFSKRK